MFSSDSLKPHHDVRMRGFANRSSVAAAIAWAEQAMPVPQTEAVTLAGAGGRVLAETITSSVDVPGFARSMMDGFAVCVGDLERASLSEPVTLKIVGDAYPGNPCNDSLRPGNTVRIMTGAPMPLGGNAVVPVEHVHLQADRIVVDSPTLIGKHVGQPGEDVAAGMEILPKGRCLRPQDVGLLSSVGINRVRVVCKPTVHLIATGNELLAAGTQPKGFQITDSNTPMLQSLILRDGGHVTHGGIVPDDPVKILTALEAEAQIIIVSGGSSVGLEDHVPRLIAERGELGVHGVAMRPSSPMGIGRLGSRLVFLLPGNPVSCLCGYDFFVGRAIRKLAGRGCDWPYREQQLRLRESLNSAHGRKDYIRVKIVDGQVEKVIPQGGSALFSAVCADGFVLISEDIELLNAGDLVDVYFYDSAW